MLGGLSEEVERLKREKDRSNLQLKDQLDKEVETKNLLLRKLALFIK